MPRIYTHPLVSKEFKKTKEAYAWHAMRGRCYNSKNHAYKYYGERGIKVCDRWKNSFNNFLADMGKAPSPNHSIDRIDVNGDYSPENCRWATVKEQARNKRRSIIVFIDEKKMALMEACDKYNIPYDYAVEWTKKGVLDFLIILEKRANLIEKSKNGRANPNLFRKVCQISLKDGSIVKEWESLRDATIFFSNKPNSHISNVAKLGAPYISAYGFGWAYPEELNQKLAEIKNWKYKHPNKSNAIKDFS